MIHRFGRHIAFMEKIAAHDDEIDLFRNGVFLQNINPRIIKIARRFIELITRAAEMNVGNMEELHSLSHQRVTDGIMIRDKKFDVQLIQTVIGNKKVEIMPEDMQLA